MKTTLRDRYEDKKNGKNLNEGFLDYFKSGSSNIETFNATIAQLKNVSSKYKLQSLQKALASAEQQFQQVVMTQQAGQQADTSKSKMISKVTSLVSGMSSFISTIKTITTQLPSLKNVLSQPATPENNRPLSELLGNETTAFTQLVAKQLQASGGGFLKKIANFFKGSGTQTLTQVMAEFGLPPETFAQEILAMTPQQMLAFSNESATVKPFQLSEPSPAAPGSGNAAPVGATQAAGTQAQTPATQSSPGAATQASAQSGAGTKPNPAAAQERDVAIQKALPGNTRNAFNSQQLGALSNEEVAQAINAISAALGIKR